MLGKTAEQRAAKTFLPAHRDVWLVGAITLLAAILRASRLDHGGLWYDELIMARITAGSWATLWSEVLIGRPPVYPAVGKLWSMAFGHSDIALRSLSAVLGVLTVPLFFAVARRLFDRRVGLVAAVLLAVSPYQIYYSQEHRYYAMCLLTSLAAMWWLLGALGVGESRGRVLTEGEASRPSEATLQRRQWAGYVVASALAFYTHTFALFLLVSIGVAVLVMYGRGGVSLTRMRRFLVSQVVLMGLILPWGLLKLMLVLGARSGQVSETGALVMPWIASPPWWAPVRTVGNFLFLGLKYLNMPWVVVGLVLLAAGLWVACRRRGGVGPWSTGLSRAAATAWVGHRGAWWIAGAWALGPMLLVFVLSFAVRPIYHDRYLIASTAGVYLLVAAGIVGISRLLPVWASLGIILLGMAGSLGNYYEKPDKGAWAEAAAWLDDNRAADEALLFTSERGIGRETANVRHNWFWYAQNEVGGKNLEIHVRSDFNKVARELQSAAQQNAGVWLVMWRDPIDPLGLEDSFAAGMVDGLALVEVKKFFDLTLMRFEWTANATELTAVTPDLHLSEPLDQTINEGVDVKKSPSIER